MSTAPVAPVKPTCESAWPAKVCAAQHQEIARAPGQIATIEAAQNALRMKSYSNIAPVPAMLVPMPGMAVLVALDLVAARHHEHAAVDAHHLDLGAIQARQRRRR